MLSLFVLYVHGKNKIVRKIGATLPKTVGRDNTQKLQFDKHCHVVPVLFLIIIKYA